MFAKRARLKSTTGQTNRPTLPCCPAIYALPRAYPSRQPIIHKCNRLVTGGAGGEHGARTGRSPLCRFVGCFVESKRLSGWMKRADYKFKRGFKWSQLREQETRCERRRFFILYSEFWLLNSGCGSTIEDRTRFTLRKIFYVAGGLLSNVRCATMSTS